MYVSMPPGVPVKEHRCQANTYPLVLLEGLKDNLTHGTQRCQQKMTTHKLSGFITAHATYSMGHISSNRGGWKLVCT